MLSRALTTFAVVSLALLASPGAAQSPAIRVVDSADYDRPATVLVASSADPGATALDWYTKTATAQPVTIISLAKLKTIFLPLTGGTMTGQLNVTAIGLAGTSPGASCIGANGSDTVCFVPNHIDMNATAGINFFGPAQAQSTALYPIGTVTNTGTHGICLGALTGFGTSCGASSITTDNASLTKILFNGSPSRLDAQNFVASVNGAAAFVSNGTGYVQLSGVASASLPTCDVGHSGSFNWDLTRHQLVHCTDWGTGNYLWGNISPLVQTGYNPLTAAATTNVSQTRYYGVIHPMRLGFTSTAAGTGAGTFSVELFDVTGTTSLCVKSGIACTLAAGNTSDGDCWSGGGGAYSTGAAHDVVLRINASTCTTAPLGNLIAEID